METWAAEAGGLPILSGSPSVGSYWARLSCGPVQTPPFSVEVKQHGTSFFVTPRQKKTLDRIAGGTPAVWFGVAVAASMVGAVARLRLPAPTRTI